MILKSAKYYMLEPNDSFQINITMQLLILTT